MQALVYNGPSRKNLEDRPKPTIRMSTDAVIKITRTTICGTDLHILKGGVASCQPGTVLGHEGVGVVDAVGPGVASFKPGIAARGFSIMDPLPRLVAELNDYRPVFLASYPTMLSLLAEEREAGRLSIEPVRLWSGGECRVPDAGAAIERAFGCPLTNKYGASECMSIAFGCREGWLHINADWVLLEPVESDY